MNALRRDVDHRDAGVDVDRRRAAEAAADRDRDDVLARGRVDRDVAARPSPCAPSAIHASVSFVSTSTSTPAPTPAVPPIASAPAMPRIVGRVGRGDGAAALEPPRYDACRRRARSSLSVSTSTTTEPATPALSPPAPPTAIRMMSSVCDAETVSAGAAVRHDVRILVHGRVDDAVRTMITAEAPTPAVLATAMLPDASVELRQRVLGADVELAAGVDRRRRRRRRSCRGRRPRSGRRSERAARRPRPRRSRRRRPARRGPPSTSPRRRRPRRSRRAPTSRCTR